MAGMGNYAESLLLKGYSPILSGLLRLMCSFSYSVSSLYLSCSLSEHCRCSIAMASNAMRENYEPSYLIEPVFIHPVSPFPHIQQNSDT